MITLELTKVHEFKVGEVVHLKILHIDMTSPGRWRLTAKNVTPLSGAEIGYACAICGIVEEAQPDGSLPEGWVKKEYKEGSHFACPECRDEAVCRVCGCTNEHACEGGCSWVEPDLCSACVNKQ